MSNQLAQETSPYLRQHAENPVDWHPWGEDTLALARSTGKPILLSIGYSACHWCHVMAHESFEDAQVAAEMNRHYVNIKVDREERPDLDQIYQLAHQMLTGRSGGWPLTVFLAPDQTPFFAGTYFPKTPRYGMPGFRDLLLRVAEAYRDKGAEIAQQSIDLMAALRHTEIAPRTPHALTGEPLDTAVRQLAQVFDDVHGGIGQAPKFPHPHELAFCLRRHALDGGELPGRIAALTLTKMAQGGIYDQLGGGFCRYSTDRTWSIPHFEKMLYDNAPLLALYTDAWLLSRDPLYRRIAEGTAAWVMREMQPGSESSDGGYYSSLDADSEGEEGKFYVWTREEVQALLTPAEFAVAAPHYGFTERPNFEERYWHVRIAQPLANVAEELGLPITRCSELIESARAKLSAVREKRVQPGRDEKVLTSWNALMAKAMAHAGRVFERPDWVGSARRSIDFLRATLWQNDRLRATYKDGRAHLNAYLDDHAFLLDALLELMQTEFRSEDLQWSRMLADLLLDQFEDPVDGGFFFVSHDHERLIHRSKTAYDNATPSGNGVAAFALQRLGHITGETRYLEAAHRTFEVFYETLQRSASSCTGLLCALQEALVPPQLVVMRGERETISQWHARLAQTYRPDTLILALPSDVNDLPAPLDPHSSREASTAAAWVCKGTTCLPPAYDLESLADSIAPAPVG